METAAQLIVHPARGHHIERVFGHLQRGWVTGAVMLP